MKDCTKCLEVKLESEFTRNASQEDGLSVWCRRCLADYRRELKGPKPADWKKKSADPEYHTKYWAKNGAKYRAAAREKYHADIEAARARVNRLYAEQQRKLHGPDWTPRKRMDPEERRVARLVSIKKTRTKHRDRFLARKRVTRAISDGRLVPLPCWTCGVAEVEAHHADYSQPLQVVWLCREHHASIHRDTL